MISAVRTNYMRKLALPPAAPTNRAKIKKALRWLIPYRELKNFQNVYIGDVGPPRSSPM